MARILIVEDTAHAAQLMTYLLEAAGHDVRWAETLAAARVAYADETPDLALFDIQLPDGDGYGLLAEVRADANVGAHPIIAVTALAMISDRAHALEEGFDGYLSKPIEPTTFSQTINAYLPVSLRGRDLPGAPSRDQTSGPGDASGRPVQVGRQRRPAGQTTTIGVITPYVSRWYFAAIVGGIEQTLRTYDTNVVLHCTGPDAVSPTRTLSPADRLRDRVDGILVVSLRDIDPELAGITRIGVPVVYVGTTSPGRPSVTIDDTAAAASAVSHLAELGHTRIAIIGGDTSDARFLPETARMDGYLQVLGQRDLPAPPELRRDGQFTARGGWTAMQSLLALDHPPSAVFCTSDEMAFGALRAAAREGVIPGRDVAIVGIDGHELSDMFDLTTVEQPVTKIGQLATTILLSHMVDTEAPPHETVLATTLVQRGSSGKPLSPIGTPFAAP